MKYLILAAAIAASSTAAQADTTCRYGTPGVFEFVSWSFKKTEGRWMAMTVTFRNKLDVALSWYEIQIEVGEHDFGFRGEVPVKAGGEATVTSELGMPQADADMFAPLKPTLCAIGVTDDKGNHKSY